MRFLKGCGLVVAVCVGVFFVAAVIAGITGASHGADGRDHKAVADEHQASQLSGGFSQSDAALYHRGLQHIANVHGKIGAFTIGQVIDQERAREHPAQDGKQLCVALHDRLSKVEGIGELVASYQCRRNDSVAHVNFTIRDDAWTSLDYDERLKVAKSLWLGVVLSRKAPRFT